MSQIAQTGHGRRLLIAEVEQTFVRVVIDLKEILVLDGIDALESPPGFRIRNHDLHGPLPDIVIEDTGDRYPVLDRVIREAANLIAIARIRQELVERLPGCKFLLPTLTDEGALAGLRSGGRTMLAEGSSFREAYFALAQKASEMQ